MVSAGELAQRLGVATSYVYEHAVELGAVRLGTGPKARLRFDVEKATTCLDSRGSQPAASPTTKPKPRRRRNSTSGFVPDLLPIRGRKVAA
jgi:hypothetical protein